MTPAGRRTGADTVPSIPAYDPELTDSGPQKVLDLVDGKKMRQADVAEVLGVSQSTVSRWLQIARSQKTRQIHYRAIVRDTFLVIIAICAVIIAISAWKIAWG